MEVESITAIKNQLLRDSEFIEHLKTSLGAKSSPSEQLELIIQQIRQILHDLIRCQMEGELREIMEENNRILMQIRESMTKQVRTPPLHEMAEDVSFSQVHRLMDQERKKLYFDEVNDASLEKSVSAFVQLKMETIEERVITMDKRLKSMEDKYETNLKSIWNVLSITESAVFQHLKDCKGNKPSRQDKDRNEETEPQAEENKKSIFGFLKFGR